MKLLNIELPETKVIEYFGIKLTVPSDVHWIACDRYGNVYGFVQSGYKPYDNSGYWSVGYPNDLPEHSLAIVDLEGMDWKQTLVHLPD